MAAYLVSDGITWAQNICVGVPVSTIQVSAADMVNSIIWTAYPWRWSMKAITAIPLVDGTQDYTFAPADYFRLTAARTVRTDTTPDEYCEVVVLRNLAPDLSKGGFRAGLTSIAYMPAITKLRLNQAASVGSGQTLEIQGEYQYQPTKITATSAGFPFPDQYFQVFCHGLLWQFMMLAKDSRQGTAQSNGKGGVIYTGQMGVFYDALMAMREAEDWGAGDQIFPSDPLGAGHFVFSGIYGP